MLCPMAMFTAVASFVLPAFFSLKTRLTSRSHLLEKLAASGNSSYPKQGWVAAPWFTGLWLALLAIPVVIYYYTIYVNAYNFPYEDDYNSALSFISDFHFGGLNAWAKLKLLFSQYNEHRIVFDRLVFLTDYWLFGQLNFRHLVLIGNVSLLLIAGLFGTAAFRSLSLNQRLFYLLPIVYALFSFQYWELSTWSMAALQNLYVIPFVLFSLYNLNQSGTKAFVLACGVAVLATYTSGNGMFVFIAGVPVLILLKSYRKLLFWAITGLITVGLYFWKYIRPPYHPDIVDSLVNHTGRAISYFFMLTGSLVGASRPKLALLFGVGLLVFTLVLVGYLWYRKQLNAHLTLLSWLLFLYLTCLSLMASRSGLGEGQAFTPRYGIVVVMLFATQAALAIEATQGYLRLGLSLAYLGVALLVYFSPMNQANRQRIADRTRQQQYSSAFYNANPNQLFLHWGNSEVAQTIMQDALQKGIYEVPKITFKDLKSEPYPLTPAPLIDSPDITAGIVPYQTADYLVLYRCWALVNGALPLSTTVQVVASSPAATYAFATQKHVWDDTGDPIQNRSYSYPGFSCVLDKRVMKPGRYTLWLRLMNSNASLFKPLRESFDIGTK